MPFKYPDLRARLDALSKPMRLHAVDPAKKWTRAPCRIFQGRLGGSRGYGRINTRSRLRFKYGKRKGQRKVKTHAAHRLSLALHLGLPVWRLNHVCHECDNPPCIEPTHLFSSTQLRNVQDCVAKGRHRNMYTGPLDQNASRTPAARVRPKLLKAKAKAPVAARRRPRHTGAAVQGRGNPAGAGSNKRSKTREGSST